MAIISITLTESPVQILAGVPRTITFDTNVPATVFYTLDGSEPSLLYSEIAFGPISLPTNKGTVVVKAFASDGLNISAIFSYTFGSNTLGNRNARDKVIFLDNSSTDGRAFGSNDTSAPSVSYSNLGGLVVDSIDELGYPDGYDGEGNIVSYTDKPYNFENYQIKYSQTSSDGKTGVGIGNLPSKISIIVPPQVTKSFNANSKLFNPKSMVIYQDGTKNPADPDNPLTNRASFSLPLKHNIRDGGMYYTTGFDGNANTGSFVSAIYNQRDNTYNFYYRDSESNRWIISKEAMPETKPADYILPQTSMAQKRVFQWIPFKRRIQPS